jgi:hypothetical protein
MQALGICPLEMRQIIESQFLPLQCECLEEEGNTLRIQIHNPDTGLIDLTVSGIRHEQFSSSRAILQLVGQLREQLDRKHLPHAKAG